MVWPGVQRAEGENVVTLLGFIIGPVVLVLAVAIAYDLKARRRRGLSGDFKEAGRLSARRNAQDRRSREARARPNKMGGPGSGAPMGGPSLGP